jgi:hypothetical protein
MKLMIWTAIPECLDLTRGVPGVRLRKGPQKALRTLLSAEPNFSAGYRLHRRERRRARRPPSSVSASVSGPNKQSKRQLLEKAAPSFFSQF